MNQAEAYARWRRLHDAIKELRSEAGAVRAQICALGHLASTKSNVLKDEPARPHS